MRPTRAFLHLPVDESLGISEKEEKEIKEKKHGIGQSRCAPLNYGSGERSYSRLGIIEIAIKLALRTPNIQFPHFPIGRECSVGLDNLGFGATDELASRPGRAGVSLRDWGLVEVVGNRREYETLELPRDGKTYHGQDSRWKREVRRQVH